MAPIDYEKIQGVVYNIIVTSMMASMAFFVCFLSVHHDWLGFFSEGFFSMMQAHQANLSRPWTSENPLMFLYGHHIWQFCRVYLDEQHQTIQQNSIFYKVSSISISFKLYHFKALLFGFFGLFLMGYGVYYQIERYIGILLTFWCKNNPNTELYRLVQ